MAVLSPLYPLVSVRRILVSPWVLFQVSLPASYKAESGVLAPLSSSRPSAVSKITSWMVGGPWSLVTPSWMDPGAAPSLNRRNAISAYELS